jgi:hypothetical protein
MCSSSEKFLLWTSGLTEMCPCPTVYHLCSYSAKFLCLVISGLAEIYCGGRVAFVPRLHPGFIAQITHIVVIGKVMLH